MEYKLDLRIDEENDVVSIVPQGTEKCPDCGAMGKVKLKEILEEQAGNLMLECECGHTDYLEKFIGEMCIEEYANNFEEFIQKLELNTGELYSE